MTPQVSLLSASHLTFAKGASQELPGTVLLGWGWRGCLDDSSLFSEISSHSDFFGYQPCLCTVMETEGLLILYLKVVGPKYLAHLLSYWTRLASVYTLSFLPSFKYVFFFIENFIQQWNTITSMPYFSSQTPTPMCPQNAFLPTSCLFLKISKSG